MINFKQEQLIEELFNYAKAKFPEIEFLGIVESPENPNALWVMVTPIEDDDRAMDLCEYAGLKEEDILIDYGYRLQLMMADSIMLRDLTQEKR